MAYGGIEDMVMYLLPWCHKMPCDGIVKVKGQMSTGQHHRWAAATTHTHRGRIVMYIGVV